MAAPKVIKAIELFFQEGSSDKIYTATLVEEGGLFSVNVEWGRRNSPLNTGKKAVNVPLAKAEKAFDKVVHEKTSKGYEAVTAAVAPAAVAPPVGEGSASRVASSGRARTGQSAQLLNAIEEDALEALFDDATYFAQQKLDGVRILVHVGEALVATNRSGQVTTLGEAIAACVAEAPEGTILDGEVVSGPKGACYWVFDILQHGKSDLRKKAYRERYAELDVCLEQLSGPVKLVASASTTKAKRALYDKLEKARAEGIVFKRADAPYTPGRPSSGGTQLKYKFVKTADVFLTANAGNAYQMAVFDGGKVRDIGKVFAGTTNASRKEIDELITRGERPVAEVQYLYATEDDLLFQPVFVQLRDDKDPEECGLAQLVRTNRSVT